MRAFNSYEKQLVLGAGLVDKRKRNRTELARSYSGRNDSFYSLNELKRNNFLLGRRFAMRIILKCTSEFTQALELLYVYVLNANLRTLYLLA